MAGAAAGLRGLFLFLMGWGSGAVRGDERGHRCGGWLMAGGLLLIAAALLLTGYNLWDERRASTAASQVLAQMPEPSQDPPLRP